MINQSWQKIAWRIIQGLGVQPGELIEVRDNSGNLNLLLEISLVIEQMGAAPLLRLSPSDYLERLWNEAPPDSFSHWTKHRQEWMKQIDKVLVLAGA